MRIITLGLFAIFTLAGIATTAAAQPAAKQVKVGFLESAGTEPWPAVITALSDLGYQKDRNLTVEYRSADGRNEALPRLAAELVSLKPDVIVAGGTPSVLALKKATTSIPIVMAGSGNPVGDGLVDSLARPGGNVTGRSDGTGELGPLRVQLVAETLPGICCVVNLRNPSNPAHIAGMSNTMNAFEALGMERRVIDASTSDQLDQILASPIEDRFKALIVTADNMFNAHMPQIAEAALRRGLAAFGPHPDDAKAGFLMGYGLNTDEAARSVAGYVDKILKGAKPTDLPVEQPTRFKLVVNLKTAKALAIAIPPLVLNRADEVIE